MDRATDRPSPMPFGHVIRGATVGAGAAALLALLGWWTGAWVLASILPGYPAMNPLTAVGLLLASATVWPLAAGPRGKLARGIGQLFAAALLTISCLRLLEISLGIDLPLDDVLFGSQVLAAPFPARMGTHSAIALACLGAALLLHDVRPQARFRLAELLLTTVLGVSLTALTGCFYSAAPMRDFMAIPTAAALLGLGSAVLLARPDRGLCGLLLGASPGGLMARRVMFVAVPLLIALGWLRLAGQRAGFYDLEVGTSLLVLGIIAVLTGIVWHSGRRLNAAEAEVRRSERALRQSLERQSRILAANPVGTLISDGRGLITDANPAFLAMTGYSRGDLPLHTDKVTPPEWRERTHQAIQEFQDRGVASPFEKEYLRKDGSRIPVLVGAATLPDSQGEALAFVVDMSGKRSAELEVERLHIFLDSIIENLPNMVFVKDARDLRFVRFNRAGEDLLGIPRAELIGKCDRDFFPREEADFFTAKDRAVLDGGTLVDIPEEPIATRHHGERVLHTKKVPILDQDGSPRYLLGISEDITERRLFERNLIALHDELARRAADLERANQELESFSYSVSHDLRAPLRHIDGFTDLLMKHSAPTLDEKGLRYLETISGAAKSMGRLIDDLLAFSRMSRTSLAHTPVDLAALVAEIRDQLAGMAAGRKIEWRIGPLPTVSGDPAMLRLVFTNLLSNAVKYTGGRSDTVIEVDATGTATEEVVRVRDNGVGFDMKYQHKLYGVFQRLHRDDEFEGTGIGLATVRRIVDRHGGRTWAEGEVDRGATFYVALPRTARRNEMREAA